SIRILMKYRFQQWLEPLPNDHLCNPVCNRGYPQRSRFAISLRDVNPLDRQREVAARGHPIPDPVKILTEILLELGNADPVNSRRATISFNALVRVPNFTLGNIKRLCLRHKRHPLAGCAYTEP